ncbi:MAG: TPR-repeat protein [Planctomycetota bacterium]|nr:TPR-repeat protein [Planctomycetota bacterium]
MVNADTMSSCFEAFISHDYERCIRQGLPLMEDEVPPEIVQVVLISLERLGQAQALANIGSQALQLTASHAWSHSLIELTLGLTAPESLLASSQTEVQRCQALFYAAERLVTAGETDQAREILRICTGLPARCAEKMLAMAELAQLEALLKSPAEKQLDDLNQRFLRLFQEQEFVEASGVIAHATELASNILGTNHHVYATLLNNLARTHCALGRHVEALAECRQALRIRRGLLGENHAQYGESLNSLGEIYRVMGDHAPSLEAFTEALRVRGETLTVQHPDYAATLMNLAALHLKTGDHERGIATFEQACSILLEALGDQDPAYVSALGNLAGAFMVVGRPEDAVSVLRHVAQVNRAVHGEVSLPHAQCLSNLAAACRKSGNPGEARLLLERVRSILGHTVGQSHPDHAQCVKDLDAFKKRDSHRDLTGLPGTPSLRL